MRELWYEHVRSACNGGGTASNPSIVGEKLQLTGSIGDPPAAYVAWIVRGMSGCLRMLDEATVGAPRMHPDSLDMLRNIYERSATIYGREMSKE